MRPEKILFLHIPKTAGTSVHNVLHRHFRKDEQVETNMYIGKNLLTNYSNDQLNQIKLVRGHFPFGLHALFKTNSFEYCTMLREPLDRCVSHYYYMLARQKVRAKPGARILKSSLKELCSSGEFLFVDNLHVRLLSGKDDIPFGQVTEEMLETAWDNLQKHFSVIGIQEEFDAFILQLCDQFELKHPWYRKQRVNRERKRIDEIDGETRAAVLERNKYDVELYRRVAVKVKAEISGKGPEFQKRIMKFRKRNAFLTRVMNLLPFTGSVAKATD